MGKRKHTDDDSLLDTSHASGDDSQLRSEKKRKKEKTPLAAKGNSNSLDNSPSKAEKKPKKLPAVEGDGSKLKKEKKSKKSQEANDSVMIVETPKKGKKRKSTEEDSGNDSVVVENATPKKKKEKKAKKVTSPVADSDNDSKPKKGKKSSTGDDVTDDSENSQPNKKGKKSKKAVSANDESKVPKKNRTENLISCVLDYLHQWRDDVKSWKFNKYYQACLINYINDPQIVNEEDFQTSMRYLKRCRGNAKKKLKIKSNALIEKGISGVMTPKKSSKSVEGQDSDKDRNDDCTLFVKNLPYKQTKDELTDGLKNIFPNAVEVRIPFKENTKNIGFAFVEFKDPAQVSAAIFSKQGYRLNGRPLFLDGIGSKNKSVKRLKETLAPEFVAAEKVRRAREIVDMLR